MKFSYIFLFLFLSNTVFCQQQRVPVDQTNIDFNQLPELVLMKKDSLPITGLIYGLYNNGNIQYEWSYQNGIPNGIWKYYFYTGKIQYEFTYVDGDKNGLCKAWHFNGRLNFESQYQNNELNGEQVFWTYTGALDTKRIYSNGTCIQGCEQ